MEKALPVRCVIIPPPHPIVSRNARATEPREKPEEGPSFGRTRFQIVKNDTESSFFCFFTTTSCVRLLDKIVLLCASMPTRSSSLASPRLDDVCPKPRTNHRVRRRASTPWYLYMTLVFFFFVFFRPCKALTCCGGTVVQVVQQATYVKRRSLCFSPSARLLCPVPRNGAPPPHSPPRPFFSNSSVPCRGPWRRCSFT